MALWQKVVDHQSLETVQQYIQYNFGPQFPMEVRHYCAQWIEEQNWYDIDVTNQQNEPRANQLFLGLVAELERQIEILRSHNNNDIEWMLIHYPKLQSLVGNLKDMYTYRSLQLIKVVQQCLDHEQQLVSAIENPQQPRDGASNPQLLKAGQEIRQKLEVLKSMTQKCDVQMQQLKECQEVLTVNIHSLTMCKSYMQQVEQQIKQAKTQDEAKTLHQKKAHVLEKEQAQTLTVKQQAAKLREMRDEVEQMYTSVLAHIEQLSNLVIRDELKKWKLGQKLKNIGRPFEDNFEHIQQWAEQIAESAFQARSQVNQLMQLRNKMPLQGEDHTAQAQLLEKVQNLLCNIINETFIVTEQPPQVLKTNTRFVAGVQHLVGGKLNLHMSTPQVFVSIVSEEQAVQISKGQIQPVPNSGKLVNSGEILNHNVGMDYHTQTNKLSALFKNMSLKRIKRATKKGTDSHAVTEEKFALLFCTSFGIQNEVLHFEVWTLSLPVVVIVHGNQEPDAAATILWDNAFAPLERRPFVAPEQVPWQQVTETLNRDIMLKVTEGRGRPARGFVDEDLSYLGEKLFGHRVSPEVLVTWNKFNKDPLPQRDFTFWQWYYQAVKLIRENLKPYWNSGLVAGFIPKNVAEKLLMEQGDGTFLVRFSDSKPGGITIAWKQVDPSTSQSKVFHLAAWTDRDLRQRSLGDRIKDLASLTYLYQATGAVPKDDVFQAYYSLTDTLSKVDGYVTATMQVHLPQKFEAMYLEEHKTPIPTPTHSMEPPDSVMTDVSQDMSYSGGESGDNLPSEVQDLILEGLLQNNDNMPTMDIESLLSGDAQYPHSFSPDLDFLQLTGD